MTLVNKIVLVDETETTDDIGQITRTESQKAIMGEVRSVSQSEFMQGRQSGISPAYVFRVSRFAYDGEKVALYGGEYLRIYRTYESDENYIELYCEREVGVSNVERSDQG